MSGIRRFFAVVRPTDRLSVASYATTPPALQRKLTMSKRRLRPKYQPTPGPSVPICAFLIAVTLYMTYITRKTSNDDMHLLLAKVQVQRAVSISSKSQRGLSDWLRLARCALTTSDRERWNRIDIINNRTYAWAHRNRFQKHNDVLHSAGKRGRTLSFEMVTLQFKGVEWAYMIIPALLAFAIIAFITAVGWQSRSEKRENALKEWTERAEQLVELRAEREAIAGLALEESEVED